MKKEKLNYYDEFITCISYSIKCIELLADILQDFSPDNLAQDMRRMHFIEHTADKAKHNITNYLLKDFLPPIEREDIVTLCHRIDNLTDNIEEILIKIAIFNVRVLKPEVSAFISLLTECANSTYSLLKEFKNFKKSSELEKLVIQINHLEESGDTLYFKHMRQLYSEGNEAKEILIWTEIFNSFEQCFDSCEQISDSIEAIVLKNS